ncbi:hypothetical protein ABZ532_27890 [Streptomyces sp. NPDC019396]|uniref:Rv1733c family protein n=1 Tax=Streptomyces sp. NPDC019396 TaxID=3154687 RepID=UPI0033C38756
MRAFLGVWRWRRNPLRRTTDLVEAWATLAAVLLLAVGAPAAGWRCGALADSALRETVRVQRTDRRPTTARVVRVLPQPKRSAAHPDARSEERTRITVVAEWTGRDGKQHRDRVPARTVTVRAVTVRAVTVRAVTVRAGDTIRIWTDSRDRSVTRPLDGGAARAHAVLAGLGVAAALAGLVESGRRRFVRRLMRHRYADLDRAWAKSGPDWGRTGTGC